MGKIEIDILNNRKVVFINRQGIRIAPHVIEYYDLKEIEEWLKKWNSIVGMKL